MSRDTSIGLGSLVLTSILSNAILCLAFTRLEEPINLSQHISPQTDADFLSEDPALFDIVQAVNKEEALNNIFQAENLGHNVAREVGILSLGNGDSLGHRVEQTRGGINIQRDALSKKETAPDASHGGGLQPVLFRPCPGGGPSPTSLQVNCTSRVRDVCSLARGEEHSLVVGFTPVTTSSHAVVSLLSWRTWLELPLLGQDTRACSYMSCPLKKGKNTTLNYKLNIPDVVGQRRDTIIWRLFDKQTQERLLCFTFRTHIT